MLIKTQHLKRKGFTASDCRNQRALFEEVREVVSMSRFSSRNKGQTALNRLHNHRECSFAESDSQTTLGIRTTT